MMLKKIFWQSYLFFVILAVLSCTSEQTQTSAIDLSGINLQEIHIERFDQEFSKLNASNAKAYHQQWKSEYGIFYQDFIEKILGIGQVTDDEQIANLLTEIADTEDFSLLGATVTEEIFPDMKAQEEALTDAFKRIKYHFPEAVVPSRFIAFFSGFAVQIPIGTDYMGIGLDMFLGANSEFYPSLIATIPMYISRRFTPENIVPRLVENYVRQEIVANETFNFSMLDNMLHEGKILYIMDLALPTVADSLKIGYTEKQLAWAKHYEAQVWKWFADENLLFDSDYRQLQPYFGEAPFTAGLGERNESAPKLGSFAGWQMVRSYMKQFPETSASQLLDMNNGRQVMEDTGYKGR